MSISTAHSTVNELLDSFTGAAPDRRAAEFQRLVGSLWSEGELTEAALSAVPALVARFDQVGDGLKGYLAVLLGLLAEAEYPALDGEVSAAVRVGLDRYLDLLGGGASGRPLTLALLYLVSHFPGDRDRVLAAVEGLPLDEDDRGRLDRSLRSLDPENPDLGRVWPAPQVWTLSDSEKEYDQSWIKNLTPAQVDRNWENDTRTVLAFSGAKAYWAVRHGIPKQVPVKLGVTKDIPPAAGIPGEVFAGYTPALRCPACQGGLSFQEATASCAGCSTVYPIASGILDLSAGVRPGEAAHDATADLLQKLSEMPSMGVYYENLLRPSYLRIAGTNWGDAVTWDDEDAYMAQSIRPVDGPVLDLACGAGRWTSVVAGIVGAERLIALDMVLPMLNVMRGRVPTVPAVKGTALDLPFADASLGAINCWNALQAFPDDAAAAIAEMGRCLRPGGTLTMMTFRWDDDPVARHFQAAHFFPSRPEGHLLFGFDELRGWLKDAGLKVNDMSGPATFVFITAERE